MMCSVYNKQQIRKERIEEQDIHVAKQVKVFSKKGSYPRLSSFLYGHSYTHLDREQVSLTQTMSFQQHAEDA